MPVISDTVILNYQLTQWCDLYCPEYLDHITGREFHSFLSNLVGKDILKAAKYIERVTGVEGNEDLIAALGTDLIGRLVPKKDLIYILGDNDELCCKRRYWKEE